jgi:hypothetical protein
MSPRDFVKPGEAELLKGGVHAAVCGLALVCGVYNAAAWVTRRERHLGVNAILYTGLVIWEACHVRHHTRQTLNQRADLEFKTRERDAIQGPFRPSRLATPSWVDSPFAGASTAGYIEVAS